MGNGGRRQRQDNNDSYKRNFWQLRENAKFTKDCERCGTEFISRHPGAKLCELCRADRRKENDADYYERVQKPKRQEARRKAREARDRGEAKAA